MKTFFGRLMQILRRKDGPSIAVKDDTRGDIARHLVEMIARTQPDECTCEEVYILIDQFTEALERGEDVSNLMPMVKRHLEICSDCLEEFEALLRVVQTIQAIVQLDHDLTNLPSRLPVGLSATVDVISARATNVLIVPIDALRELSPGQYAVFVEENGQLKLRTVEVGLTDTTSAEIKSGLQEGEVVSTGVVQTVQ